MFTGIVNTFGVLQESLRINNQLLLKIKPQIAISDWLLGESIAVNGCCLTISKFSESWFQTFVSAETFSCTNLKNLTLNGMVNLERALKLNDRMGGHIVTGHVDEMAKINAIRTVGASQLITFTISAKNSIFLIEKGSITIDGISLTIVECNKQQCTINLIPETMNNTAALCWHLGYLANIEIDALIKTATTLKKINPLSKDFLYYHGYL